jgi:hypothetical protein
MKTRYDEDFAQWSEETAAVLRDRQFDEVDWENLAEEIESLGKLERQALASHLTKLLHLLKWQRQAGHRSRSWCVTILNQRQELAALLEASPSLWRRLDDFSKVYAGARKLASVETGLPESALPAECPYTVEQILDQEFLPE